MLVKHGVRSCLEYAKSVRPGARPIALQPGSGSAPRVRRSRGTRICQGPIVGRDAHRVRLHPPPHCTERKTGRRGNQVSGLTRCRPVEERRAPAAKNIGSRRRRWTVDLTGSHSMWFMVVLTRIRLGRCRVVSRPRGHGTDFACHDRRDAISVPAARMGGATPISAFSVSVVSFSPFGPLLMWR